jgi:sulfite reductase alpha subunit-like flavoprotein
LHSFRPGDVAVVYPQALDEDVETFLAVCKWTEIADEPLKITIHDRKFLIQPSQQTNDTSLLESFWPVSRPLPQYTNLRTLAQSYLDINAVPRRTWFELVRHFASDDLEREKLEEFCTTEGQVCLVPQYLNATNIEQEDLYDYCQIVRRTITEVLEEFRSITIPLERLFDAIPPLRPRQFSIASSLKVSLLAVSPMSGCSCDFFIATPETDPPLRCRC